MAELTNVQGLKELLDTMQALPPEIVSKRGGPVRSALRRAAVVIQKEAKANVRRIVDEPNRDGRPSKSTGLLEKSITVSRKKPRGRMKGEVYHVRVKKSAKSTRGVRAAMYGAILEFGYEHLPAKSWMRNAFETKKQEAVDTFVAEMRKGLDRAVKKARKLG